MIASKPLPSYFIPSNDCKDPYKFGPYCNGSTKPCDLSKPCLNSKNCINDPVIPDKYFCVCANGFTGPKCELDIRPCKPNTCFDHGMNRLNFFPNKCEKRFCIEGTCKELNSNDYYCNCTKGWMGVHCEHMVNKCDNITCLNKGICRALFLDYKCECLYGTSGRHCEDMSTGLVVRQYVSKSFAYIAITVLCFTAIFIITMDILKYGFGIDPVHEERERAKSRRNNRQNRKI